MQRGEPPPCLAGLPLAEPVVAASVAFAGELGSLRAVSPCVLSEETPVLRAQSSRVSGAQPGMAGTPQGILTVPGSCQEGLLARVYWGLAGSIDRGSQGCWDEVASGCSWGEGGPRGKRIDSLAGHRSEAPWVQGSEGQAVAERQEDPEGSREGSGWRILRGLGAPRSAPRALPYQWGD